MKKFLVLTVILFVTTSLIAFNKKNHSAPRVLGIRLSLSSGMCYGYCYFEVNVEPDVAILMTSPSDGYKQTCPELKVTADLSRKHWQELTELIDHDALLALPEHIGCPGCVDQVVESIEIRYSDHTKKRTDFNTGVPPVEIRPLSEKLVALKRRLAKELPPLATKQCELRNR